jgi:hypothetical protein
VPKRRHSPGGPRRIPPAKATSEAVERILPKRQVQVETGDVVMTREPVPRVNPSPTVTSRAWRYRVALFPESPENYRIFTSFQHAASAAEQIAAANNSRVLYVEDGVVSLLTDHRARR